MRDRDLVRLYWPVELRPAFDALFGLEDAFADVVASSTQPALGAIRLAWWRDALGRLDQFPPPPEPRLNAVAADLLPRGIGGARLATLEDGWTTLFDERPDEARLADHGALLFAIGADLLGTSDPLIADAGRVYALADVARRGLHPGTSVSLTRLAGHRFARKLRPLTALARLAARDIRSTTGFEPEATPGRAASLLSHRLFGMVC
jgi:phytoene synthase